MRWVGEVRRNAGEVELTTTMNLENYLCNVLICLLCVSACSRTPSLFFFFFFFFSLMGNEIAASLLGSAALVRPCSVCSALLFVTVFLFRCGGNSFPA